MNAATYIDPVEREFPSLAPARLSTSEPGYKRVPLSTRVSWRSNENGTGTFNRLDLTVREPSLLRICSMTPALGTAQQVWADFLWTPLAARSNSTLFNGDNSAVGRQPFVGPYAFFPAPGQYTVIAVHEASFASPTLTFHGELMQGIPINDVIALMSSGTPRFVESKAVALAAATTQAVIVAYHSSFFLFRDVLIQNTGANVAVINFGPSPISGYSRYTLNAGASVSFSALQLGRHTLTAISGAGTTLNVFSSFW